jgi:hypothetical protein
MYVLANFLMLLVVHIVQPENNFDKHVEIHLNEKIAHLLENS